MPVGFPHYQSIATIAPMTAIQPPRPTAQIVRLDPELDPDDAVSCDVAFIGATAYDPLEDASGDPQAEDVADGTAQVEVVDV